MTSLTLPNINNLPTAVQQRLHSLPPINVYRMIANAPQCVIPWTDMVSALYQSSVSIRYREIAILRQASQAKSPYELHQHQFIARANGITQVEINHICDASPVTHLSNVENLLCQMADELENTATINDDTMAQLKTHFNTTELTELIILTSFYCCVARVLNATGVTIEKDNPLKDASSPINEQE